MFLKISQHSQENTCAGPCRPSFTDHLQWLLLDFCGSKYFCSAESGIYCWQSHWFLLRTPLKTRPKPQNLPFRLPIQYSFRYYWYWYIQKQSSSAVLHKRWCYKYCKIHKNAPKKRFRRRCFLANSAKFLVTSFLKNPSDGCFCINTSSLYCRTMTFHLFKNNVIYVFRLSTFSA